MELVMDAAGLAWNHAAVRTWPEVIQCLVDESGTSAAKVVAKAGLAKDTITRIKLGHTRTPSRRTLRALAAAVGKTLQDVDRLRDATPERSGIEHLHGIGTNRVVQAGQLGATVAPSEQQERERGRSAAEVEMLRRLGGTGYAAAGLLASVLERHPDAETWVATELIPQLTDMLVHGAPKRPKAKASPHRRQRQ